MKLLVYSLALSLNLVLVLSSADSKVIESACFESFHVSDNCKGLLDATVLETGSILKGMAFAKARVENSLFDNKIAQQAHEIYTLALTNPSPEGLKRTAISSAELEGRLQKIVKRLLGVEDGSELAWSELKVASLEGSYRNEPNNPKEAVEYAVPQSHSGISVLAQDPDEQVMRGLLNAAASIKGTKRPFVFGHEEEESRFAELFFKALFNDQSSGEIYSIVVEPYGTLKEIVSKRLGPAVLRKALQVALGIEEFMVQSTRVKLLTQVISKIILFKRSGATRNHFYNDVIVNLPQEPSEAIEGVTFEPTLPRQRDRKKSILKSIKDYVWKRESDSKKTKSGKERAIVPAKRQKMAKFSHKSGKNQKEQKEEIIEVPSDLDPVVPLEDNVKPLVDQPERSNGKKSRPKNLKSEKKARAVGDQTESPEKKNDKRKIVPIADMKTAKVE